MGDEDQAYRKFKLQCEEVQGHYCLTQFYGMEFTTDKLRSMVRKWQSLIEQHVDKLIPESIGKEVEKACSGIYPLQNVFVRKVKMLKKPKFDLTKLLEVHADSGKEDTGAKVKVAVDSKAEG